MATETDSIRALWAEARETVILTEKFYSCVVKDPRHVSGEFAAVKPGSLPLDIPKMEGLEDLIAEPPVEPVTTNVQNGTKATNGVVATVKVRNNS